jgi:magnesium transporter
MFKKTLNKTVNVIGEFTGISRFLPKTAKKSSSPGTGGYVGVKRKDPVTLHILDYDEMNFTEKDLKSVEESLPFKRSPTVTWLNISGVHDIKIIEEVGKLFSIHPLVLEDIANTTQRSKLEEYDEYIYIVLKMVLFNKEKKESYIEQVSLIIGKDFVISFQEKNVDVLDSLRERIRNGKGRIRRLGSDYLAYGIIDAVIDHYYTILEEFGEQIGILEEELLKKPDQRILNSIYRLKQELDFLRKSVWPMREMVGSLLRIEHKLISESIQIFLRDIYDHTIQVVDTIESFRDIMSGMLDLYLSTVSNKMNEVMKVLTIFAAIFIPLTFIAGVYGMNFEHMPELQLKFGYFGVLAIMLSIGMGMLIYFNKRDWL